MLADLPVALLKLILAFASDGRHEDVVPNAPYIPEQLLDVLTRVDPLWRPVVERLRRELSVSRTISLAAMTSVVNTIEDQPEVPLRSLTITADGFNDNANGTITAESLCAWFSKMPQLERLDLCDFHLNAAVLPRIVDAASRTCRRLQALILGTTESDEGYQSLALLRSAVHEAIQLSHGYGANGGFLQLEFPIRYATSESQDLARVKILECDFFGSLAQFCPRLQYLNTLSVPEQAKARVLALKKACCPLPQWEDFWEKCGELRHVNWLAFPYSDAHFKVASMYAKPHVRTLVFDGAEGAHTADANGQSTYSSTGLSHMFSAFRTITELEIKFDHSLSIAHGFQRQFLWNDSLLIALASSSCGDYLEVFKLLEYDGTGGANIPTPLSTITDTGVIALALLPKLRLVEMKVTQVTGLGVYTLMKCASPVPVLNCQPPPRIVKLDIGCLLLEGFIDDEEEDHIVEFYEVVQQILELICQDPQAIKGKWFVVELTNRSRRDPDTDEWRDVVNQLMHKTQEHVHVSMEQDSDSRIEKITFRSHLER